MNHTESLFETHPDPIVQYQSADPPVVTALNPAFERQFDVETALVDQPLSETLTAAGITFDKWHTATETGGGDDSEADTVDSTLEATAANGRLYALRTVEGREASYLLLTDVSCYAAERETLEAENDQLERFARMVSHDLRNPLEVAQSRLVAARETGDAIHFEKVAAAHTRIRELVEDVLTLAKSGTAISETELVDIAAVAREAWASVDADQATLSVDNSLGAVEADPERLRTVFENLFRNAVTHGGPTIDVSVDALDGGFAVADTGPGVPADKRDEVFEAGVSAGDGTTGLGLSIVDEIAAAHGWDVSLTESQVGGAQFEFRI